MAIEINGKVYRNLQEQVEKNKEDIEELQEQEPVEYSAGDGIDIEEGVISVDDTVALKTDLNYNNLSNKPDLTVYATKNELNGYIKDNDTNYASTFRGQGAIIKEQGSYTSTLYNDGNIARSIPHQPGYTYTLPDKTGTFAMTSDIPSLTNYVTLDGTQTITGSKTFSDSIVIGNSSLGASIGPIGTGFYEHSGNTTYDFGMNLLTDEARLHYFKTVTGDSSSSVDNIYKLPHTDVTGRNAYTLATTADIPTLSGLTMYNYKITISGVDSGTSTTRSAVYIVSLPYQWDYSSLSKIEILRLVPVWSVVVDTDTTAGNKNIGRFHWQTGAIAIINWIDGTNTVMDLTGGFNATIAPAAPAHW